METLNSLASTASKVIWGEQTTATNETAGKEPVSGVQGQGTAAEPFDQGNAATPNEPIGKSDPFNSASTPPTTTKTELPIRTTTNLTKSTPFSDIPESTPSTDIHKATPSTDIPESTPSTDIHKATPSTDIPESTPSTDIHKGTSSTDFHKTTPFTDIHKATPSTDIPRSTPSTDITSKSNETSTPHIPMIPTSAAAGGEPKPLENTEGTGVTGATQKFTPTGGVGGDIRPSESSSNPGAVPASDAAFPQKHQGADRPSEAPIDNKEDDAEAIVKKRDPNDHSGEPMHMHNGPEKGVSVPKTQEERRESKVGMPGGQEHGKEPKGTGEEWVKTSGLVADGGDFDATKPGAGKEADRLLEEKGIHRDAKGNMDGKPETGKLETSPGGAEKEKVSKIGKLKEKLHIGHKDK